ncbi:hypothetical protein DICPUDRAFT_43851 [Dictyostelium purpureum]|uniref:Mitochondrial processing peptidase alpha subunit n=1 Tax=Dictyostelium purpureum TaxID=5786 RepID=F1A4X6_DICPU|nr:uncharacterized protein DICPUDRAFT_43851 [Dictyostelium purpureum]EGC28753.1 hypothetical protein DICPUDRAFT_43851 [Dictyostelium purpureum]|eukprot:XP_003294721.1 hypothetical protein DICPUDRAFT_43851 [Dictyostelium purpureum]
MNNLIKVFSSFKKTNNFSNNLIKNSTLFNNNNNNNINKLILKQNNFLINNKRNFSTSNEKDLTSPFTSLSEIHPKLVGEKLYDTTNYDDKNNEKSKNFKAQITTLPNGIRVVSKQTHEGVCAIGLYVNAGTKYESPQDRGVFNLLEKMTFKKTKNHTTSDIIRELEEISLNAMASSSKEMINVSIEVLRKDLEFVLSIFSDQIKCPEFEEEEIKEQIEVCIRNWEMMTQSASDQLLSEILTNVAYGDGGLGNLVLANPEEYMRINKEKLKETLKKYYVGKNIVISVTGAEHSDVTQLVDKYFGDIPYTQPNTPSSDAIDNQTFYRGENEESSWLIAFPYSGLSTVADSKEIITGLVLQSLLGGGSSYSTGGPGKGMQSRLNLNVVYKSHAVKNCHGFFFIFNKFSLFGISLTTNAGYLSNGISLVLNEFLMLNKTITQTDLDRAKRTQKSQILQNLELRSIQCDDMARHVLALNTYKSPEEICALIDSVTINDVKELTSKLIQSNPSVVSLVANENEEILTAEQFSIIVKNNLNLFQ